MVKITFENMGSSEAPSPEGGAFSLSPLAAERLNLILARPENEGKFLRISVKGGGCNGYSYHLKLDNQKQQGDLRVQHDHLPNGEVRLNRDSAILLGGSTLDFLDTAEVQQFIVHNPNAKSACGCGNSFGL
jgi:iron-sulfur cluster assembly accessory protein